MDLKEIFKSKDELPNRCYLCGKSATKLQKDHLPPKCIFPQQYWSRLIYVPICSQCHAPRKKDDEYFRDYMSLWCGKNVPQEVHQKRRRSWKERPVHKIGTIRNLTRVWIDFPSGLRLPGYALKGEMKRINPVLECIARGHYFSYRREIIPESDSQILMTKTPFVKESNDPAVRFWFNQTVLQEVIPGMFKFKLSHFQKGDINISNWFLEFYNMVQFFVQFSWIEKIN